MKITDITVQARDKNRVNVSVDGKYRLSLDIFQVGELGLKVGREYSEEELAALEQESQFGKLYTRTLAYISLRPRSKKEVKDYLHKKTRPVKKRHPVTGKMIERPGLSPELAERVLARLVEKKYLNDEQFAQFWLEHRFIRTGTSVRRLTLELRQKGVDEEIIQRLLEQHIRSDEEELAKLIQKKRHRYRDTQKFMQYLVRQGFSYGDVKQALESSRVAHDGGSSE